ncbi:MAG TPA: hypothetical protein VE569_10635 [Acidimicrobiia bacterium]|nr:hypothetical protein [Acidimicrobiia bacterium]
MGESSEEDVERARQLGERIVRLGHERCQVELVELAGDPSTRRLLGLLPDSERSRAEIHLKSAERWEQSKRETNTRRLDEARRALDGLDLELARGLTRKIDGRYLSDEQLREHDQLLLDISARAMEMESLSETGRELIEETEPKRQPWWRRWFG